MKMVIPNHNQQDHLSIPGTPRSTPSLMAKTGCEIIEAKKGGEPSHIQSARSSKERVFALEKRPEFSMEFSCSVTPNRSRNVSQKSSLRLEGAVMSGILKANKAAYKARQRKSVPESSATFASAPRDKIIEEAQDVLVSVGGQKKKCPARIDDDDYAYHNSKVTAFAWHLVVIVIAAFLLGVVCAYIGGSTGTARLLETQSDLQSKLEVLQAENAQINRSYDQECDAKERVEKDFHDSVKTNQKHVRYLTDLCEERSREIEKQNNLLETQKAKLEAFAQLAGYQTKSEWVSNPEVLPTPEQLEEYVQSFQKSVQEHEPKKKKLVKKAKEWAKKKFQKFKNRKNRKNRS